MDQKGQDFKLTSPLPKRSKRTGRPPGGKRSHPDYEKVTIYIRKTHHRSADIKLRKAGKVLDFSDLVDKLVAEWDSSHGEIEQVQLWKLGRFQ